MSKNKNIQAKDSSMSKARSLMAMTKDGKMAASKTKADLIRTNPSMAKVSSSSVLKKNKKINQQKK